MRSHSDIANCNLLQIEEVCGDLYPDRNERKTILGAMQAHYGPLVLAKVKVNETAHFDNWIGIDKKKHKGCSIGDLEKARLDPASYGVTGIAVLGSRPERPLRQPSPITNVPHVHAHAQHVGMRTSEQGQGTQPLPPALPPALTPPPPPPPPPQQPTVMAPPPPQVSVTATAGNNAAAAAAEDHMMPLDEQGEVLGMIAAAEEQLKAAQQKADDASKAKKAAKDAAMAAKKAAKPGGENPNLQVAINRNCYPHDSYQLDSDPTDSYPTDGYPSDSYPQPVCAVLSVCSQR